MPALSLFAAGADTDSTVSRNLLQGAEYSIRTQYPASDDRIQYGDEAGNALTDGKTPRYWAPVGWANQGRITVSLQLRHPVTPRLLRCHAMGGGKGSVYFPNRIAVYGVEEASRSLLGVSVDRPSESQIIMQTAWLIVDLLTERSFDRFEVEIEPSRGSWTMINEIEMFESLQAINDAPRSEALKTVEPVPEFAGSVFQTNPRMYSSTDLYSFYPKDLPPISTYQIGMAYTGDIALWPPYLHMQKIREFGFNIVHGEGRTAHGSMRWGTIWSAPETYDWQPLDRFIQDAYDAGLYAVLSTDVGSSPPPAWILREHPDAAFINPYGEVVPGTIDYGHPAVLELVQQFLARVARRYRDYPHITAHYIADEYSINNSYYQHKNLAGQNFNARMRRGFTGHLEEKYENIEAFNAHTQRRYADFAEIQPGMDWLTGDSYGAEWLEWCRFRAAETARVYRAMHDAVKQETPAIPVILSAPGLGRMTQGLDPADFEFIDGHGYKQYYPDMSPNRSASATVFQSMAGHLKHTRYSLSNKMYVVPRAAMEAGLTEEYSVSPHTYIRGAFEDAGARIDSVIFWYWDSRVRRTGGTNPFANSAGFIYMDGDSYKAGAGLQPMSGVMPFFAKYGNLISKARLFPVRLGGLNPSATEYHEARAVLASSLAREENNPYPRQVFTHLYKWHYQQRQLTHFLADNNYSFEMFTRLPGPDDLAAYKVFSLVGANHLADEEISVLSHYAETGGALIIDADTAKFTDRGEERVGQGIPFPAADNVFPLDQSRHAENAGLHEFLAKHGVDYGLRVITPDLPIGGYLLQIAEPGLQGTLVVLVNRGADESTYENVEFVVSKAYLPPEPYHIYRVDPYPALKEVEVDAGAADELHLFTGPFADAKVFFILDKRMQEALDIVQEEALLPRYKRVPWWDERWQYRLPLTVYGHTAGAARSFTLNLHEECARIGLEQELDISSLRLVKYADAGGTVIPVEVAKVAPEQGVLAGWRVTFNDPQPAAGKPAEGYYLYLNPAPVDDGTQDCFIREAPWYLLEQDGVVIMQRQQPTEDEIEVVETDDGLIFSNLPVAPDDNSRRVFVRGLAPHSSARVAVTVNGQDSVAEFTDFERLAHLAEITMPDSRIELRGAQFRNITVSAVVLAPATADVAEIAAAVAQLNEHLSHDIEVQLMETL